MNKALTKPSDGNIDEAVKRKRQKAAAMLGSIKSEKKAAAARLNGEKGGRPRKTPRRRDIYEDQKGDIATAILKMAGGSK